MRTRSRRAQAIAVALLVSVGVSACTSGSSSGHPSASATSAPSVSSTPIEGGGNRTLTASERSFGTSVGAIPGAVYQSDVVVIGGGADSIVGALDNGLVWSVKGSAPGASKLAVGKIMVATSFATGRVEQVMQVGGNVQVTLAPVGLTDIFEELHVDTSSPVSLAQPLGYSFDSSPVAADGDTGAAATPPSTQPSIPPTAPPEHNIANVKLTDDTPVVPPGVPTIALQEPTVSPPAVKKGKFELTPYCCYPSQGVHIAYNEPTGRMAATVGLVMAGKPLVDFHIDINAGGLKEAVFELNGPKAIEFQFDAATKDVSGNYRSPTLTVPFAFTFAVGVIPFTVSLVQSVHASIQLAGQAAFSSKGEYLIGGNIGFAYRNGHFGVTKTAFTPDISSLQNATSYSVGINALSIGYGARFSVGIGVIGFNGGPFFQLNGDLAIDKDGSPPQTSLTLGCATAAVSVTASYGVGYTIPEVVTKAVNGFLKLFNAKPISSTGGPTWGPYTLWNPGPGTRCLKRS